MKNKRFLCVDGDFFCHRALHGIRMVNKNITLDSVDEMNNFNKTLITHVHSLFNNFVNEHHQLIDQIIFVFDNKSWRKRIEANRPYYLENDKEVSIGYKDNRTKMREESDINYENFSLCKKEFVDLLKNTNIFPVFHFDGAEGDDQLIMLKTKLLMENPDNKMIVFCTDGDLKQLLYFDEKLNQKSDSIILYRNIKSKAAPEGEFVITEKLFEELYGKRDEFGREDIMDAFLRAGNDTNESYYKQFLFNINFKDNSGKASFQRKPGEGISIGTPTLTLLTKIITGDKKDNVFPLFRWKTKTGNSIRNVTETNIINCLNDLDFKFNDKTCLSIYNDKQILTQLLYGLRDEVKQSEINIQLIGKHFVHNRKILDIRTINYIPNEIYTKFEMEFEKFKLDGILETNLNQQILSKLKQDFSDSTNILSQSLPDLPDELKGFSDLL